MDDEDIVLNDESPELPANFGEGGVWRSGNRPATPDEVEEFRQALLAYANRPSREK